MPPERTLKLPPLLTIVPLAKPPTETIRPPLRGVAPAEKPWLAWAIVLTADPPAETSSRPVLETIAPQATPPLDTVSKTRELIPPPITWSLIVRPPADTTKAVVPMP